MNVKVKNHNIQILPSGYKMTELGPLPKEWEVVRLGEVAEFETGKRMKGGALKCGEVLSIGGEHISDFGNIVLEKPKFISKEFYDSLKKGKLKKKDVIICKDGAKTGKVAYVKELYDYMAINEHVFIIRAKNCKILNSFIFFFLFSKLGQSQIRKAYHGLIGGITNADVFNIHISLPPLPEQRKIAAILSTVQKDIETERTLIERTKELKRAMMHKLFTEGTRGEKQKITEIGPIPESWEVVKLGEVADINYGKANPKTTGFIPVVGSGGVFSWTDTPLIKKHTIVIGRKGTAGKCWLMEKPSYPSDTTFYLDWKKDVNIKFIFNFMVIHQLSGEHAKTTLPSLQRHDLENLKIPLPPLPEQQAIADILSTIDQKIEHHTTKKQKLEELFRTLLHELMTARVRVNDINLDFLKMEDEI